MDNQVVKLEINFDLDRFLWGMKAKEGNVSQILKIELESIFN